MFGAIYGDIVGSVYEFNNIRTKEFELFSSKSKFTDDTVMTLAVANALIQFDDVMKVDDVFTSGNESKGEDLKAPWRVHLRLFKTLLITEMHRLGDIYPHAGYGGNFSYWLREKKAEPYGSYGNGTEPFPEDSGTGNRAPRRFENGQGGYLPGDEQRAGRFANI